MELELTNTQLEKLLTCTVDLPANINKFIEIFVNYYGEEEREIIESRFKSALYCGYLSERELSSIIRELEERESRRLYEQIISNCSLPVNSKMLFNDYSISFQNLHPLNKYAEFAELCLLTEEGRKELFYREAYKFLCTKTDKITYEEFMNMAGNKTIPSAFKNAREGLKEHLLDIADISSNLSRYESQKKQAVEFLSPLYPNVTNDNIEEILPKLSEMEKLVNNYNQAKEDYLVFKKKYQQYYDILDYNSNLRDQLSEKYLLEYLKKAGDYLPGSIQDKVKLELHEKGKLPFPLSDIFGYSLESTGCIEYFSSDMEKKLLNDKTSTWEKESIKRNRLRYFQIIGVDYGSDYESYASIPNLFPNSNLVDELITIKQRVSSIFKRDYCANRIPEKSFVAAMEERGYIDKDPTNIAEVYDFGSTCVCPNLVQKDGSYELAATINIAFSRNHKVKQDHDIIHELNHLYELSLVEATSDHWSYICGWDQIFSSSVMPETIEKDREKRPYELFNEIINEKIAKDICKIMVDNKIEIFGKAVPESYGHVTGYDDTNYLVAEFFDTYKKEIIASRKNNNIDIIFNAVGKENFDALNSLFAIHNQCFGGFAYYNLLKDLNENKDTDNTRIYNELITKRDQILANMKMHYEANYHM